MRTQRTSELPPFYTHGIGSLPRPKVVRELPARRGEMPPERFAMLMDEMVIVTGDYKPILPRLRDVKVDRVNLEFAYTGTGDVSDLELLPEHPGVGMGVVDVRGEQLQTVEQIEAIAAAGAAIIDPRRIALNPDCGFAPDAGETPTIDEAYEKPARLVAAGARLRGRFGPT